MPFNQRNSHTPPLKELAPDELTTDLRNSFWNEVTDWIPGMSIGDLCHAIWKQYYKKLTDKIPYVQYHPMDGYSSVAGSILAGRTKFGVFLTYIMHKITEKTIICT